MQARASARWSKIVARAVALSARGNSTQAWRIHINRALEFALQRRSRSLAYLRIRAPRAPDVLKVNNEPTRLDYLFIPARQNELLPRHHT
jgi:hypothetical protein